MEHPVNPVAKHNPHDNSTLTVRVGIVNNLSVCFDLFFLRIRRSLYTMESMIELAIVAYDITLTVSRSDAF